MNGARKVSVFRFRIVAQRPPFVFHKCAPERLRDQVMVMFAAGLLLDRAMQQNNDRARCRAFGVKFAERYRFGNFNVVDDNGRRCEGIIGMRLPP